MFRARRVEKFIKSKIVDVIIIPQYDLGQDSFEVASHY